MKLLGIVLAVIVVVLFIFMASFGVTTLVWNMIGPQVLMAIAAALTLLYLGFIKSERL